MTVSTSSGFHTHRSWGRTRQPKNLVNPEHSTPASISFTAAGDGDAQGGLASVTDGAGGTRTDFVTENQRYLHITYTSNDDDGNCAIALEVYMYASGQWATLDGWTNLTAENGVYKHKVVEIHGIDKVRFRVSGVKDTKVCTIFPACSTF